MGGQWLEQGSVRRISQSWHQRLGHRRRNGKAGTRGARISVVIPTTGEVGRETLDSLPLVHEVLVVGDPERRGASWARNLGIAAATGELIFLCDDDVVLEAGALEKLRAALDTHPDKAYAYGWYRRGDEVVGRQKFDPELLRDHNYISTMSLVRASANPQFDEELHRFQDWDLWLTLLDRGLTGVFVDELIFTTEVRAGITFAGAVPLHDATATIRTKHFLPIDDRRLEAERRRESSASGDGAGESGGSGGEARAA